MDNNEVDELQQDLQEHIRAFTRARVSVVCSTASRFVTNTRPAKMGRTEPFKALCRVFPGSDSSGVECRRKGR
jgi:hypothetical protein